MEPETVFKAMGDRTRHRALALLTCHELSVSELVELLRQPQSTVSRHLRVLREAGLIRDRRDGSTVLYSVPPATNGAGDADLADRLLEWIAQQPVPSALAARLQAVIDRRRDMSDRFFTQVARHWDTLREESFGTRFHLEAIIALLPPGWTVVDVGTGTGYLLPALARHFRRVIGVDPVEAMLEAARRRTVEHRLTNVALLRGDLSQLPIRSAAADLALAVLVLHHVSTPHDALAELHRVVREGGRVLVVEQEAHHNETFHDRMQDRWWGFEPDEFATMLESVGFAEVRSRNLTNLDQAPDAPNLFVVTGCKTIKEEDDR